MKGQVAPKRLQVALGVQLGGAKLRLEGGLAGVLVAPKSLRFRPFREPCPFYCIDIIYYILHIIYYILYIIYYILYIKY